MAVRYIETIELSTGNALAIGEFMGGFVVLERQRNSIIVWRTETMPYEKAVGVFVDSLLKDMERMLNAIENARADG